jgi:hypothetical protein
MFRSAVHEYIEAVRSQDLEQAALLVKQIEGFSFFFPFFFFFFYYSTFFPLLETYLGKDSAFEVNCKARSGGSLAELEVYPVDLFDDVLEKIDRDLGRALQTLWSAPVFKTFVKYRKMIDVVNAIAPKQYVAGTMRIPAGLIFFFFFLS